MNNFTHQQGPDWSPDIGRFWIKGDKMYCEDGDVVELHAGSLFRTMPHGIPESEWHKYEDYSAWSDEKREAVKAQKKIERDAANDAHQKWVSGIRALQESARSKLTPEEYEAVQIEEYRL